MKLRTARLWGFGIVSAVIIAGLVVAAGSGIAEDNPASPSSSVTSGAAPAAGEGFHETNIPALPGLRIEGDGAGSSDSREARSGSGASHSANGGLSYTVRPGDSMSAIAQIFGLDTTDLASANHLDEDAVLRSGQVLQVPNPFAALTRHLQKDVEDLRADAETAHQKEQIDAAKIRSLSDQVEQLGAANSDLQHGVHVLPWWRGLALSTAAAALLMLGVTALTVLEWLMLRRRFRAMVEVNEALRRLDQKYKVALAKAELRLQQLYGRRRSLEDERDMPKSPDEIEIERLNQQLRELLEQHLDRLGFSRERGNRRSRFSDLMNGVEETAVQARASRR
jgi:LysM repeat protein